VVVQAAAHGLPSSVGTEYRAVANVVAECFWLRQLLLELSCPIDKATVVYYDNVSAFYLSTNPVHQRRTKHIEFDIHFIREQVALGHIRVNTRTHVPTICRYHDQGLAYDVIRGVSI
jgi:hypothetical protein